MDTTVGASPSRMACQSVPPTPLMLKMPSVMMAPPMRAPRIAAEESGDGDEGVTQDVARHDGAVGQALGAGGAHVVGGDVLGDGLAGESDDVGKGNTAEDHGWHGQ